MSCDWFLRCDTCGMDGWGCGGDFNHQMQGFKDLLPHLPLFVTLARAGFDVDYETLGVYGNVRAGLARWALEHDGHRIIVKSEYGDIADQCSKRIDCAFCGAEHHRCGLPDDHAGDCAVAPTSTACAKCDGRSWLAYGDSRIPCDFCKGTGKRAT